MRRKAFTLIELIVVIAIIGIIATIITVSYIGAESKTRDSKRIGDINAINSAVKLFYADNRHYPRVDNNIAICFSRVRSCNVDRWQSTSFPYLSYWLKDYISNLPVDPQNPSFDSDGRPTWQSQTDLFFYTYSATRVSYVLAARMENENDGNYQNLNKVNIAPVSGTTSECLGSADANGNNITLKSESFDTASVNHAYNYYFRGENLLTAE